MPSPLHIAFISEHASPVAVLGGADAGGQNVYVDELSRSLAAVGHRVDVYTRRDSPHTPEAVEWARGVRVINVEAGPALPISKDAIWPYMVRFRDEIVRFWLREGEHPDIVHANFWMSGWAGVELRQRVGTPIVQIFHALGTTKARQQGADDTSPRERIAVEQRVVREADRVIAQCPCELRELLADYGAQAEKVALIPAAVNTERFHPIAQQQARQMLGLPPHLPLLVYVGRLLPRKDVRNIVRALALLVRGVRADAEPPRLLVVGGESAEPDPAITPEIGELHKLAGDLGMSHLVEFVGHKQPDVLHLYYSAADAAITTPWYEPFGLTPLEAMACGAPVVGSAVGGIPFTVQHGVSGLLVPPRDPTALAEAVGSLLSQPELRERMGAAARARVEREFTWATVASRVEALYHSMLHQSPSEQALLATHR
ncbi:MAG: glycosyltransferase [Chloroflexota bacterium]|nr:glycosyltransferase [Chloroflexota bacterium]